MGKERYVIYEWTLIQRLIKSPFSRNAGIYVVVARIFSVNNVRPPLTLTALFFCLVCRNKYFFSVMMKIELLRIDHMYDMNFRNA